MCYLMSIDYPRRIYQHVFIIQRDFYKPECCTWKIRSGYDIFITRGCLYQSINAGRSPDIGRPDDIYIMLCAVSIYHFLKGIEPTSLNRGDVANVFYLYTRFFHGGTNPLFQFSKVRGLW